MWFLIFMVIIPGIICIACDWSEKDDRRAQNGIDPLSID
jgi:hypothetical protein